MNNAVLWSLINSKIFTRNQLRGATFCFSSQNSYIYGNSEKTPPSLCCYPIRTGQILKNIKYCKGRIFSTSHKSGEPIITRKNSMKNELKAYIQQNKDKLKNTEEKIKKRGHVILKDIRDTRDKVKEKVEEVIEVKILKS